MVWCVREASRLDRCGKPTPYEMNGDGRVTLMNDEHNNTTTYGYDGATVMQGVNYPFDLAGNPPPVDTTDLFPTIQI